MRTGMAAAVLLAIAGGSPAQTTFGRVDIAAEDLASKLKTKILAQQGSGPPFRIAVFPFGNLDGKSTPSLGGVGKTMQGELIQKLTVASDDKFVPMNLGEIRTAFVGLSDTLLQNLGAGDVGKIAATATAAGVDGIVVGNIDAKNYVEVVSANHQDVPVNGRLVFKDATFASFSYKFGKGEITELGGSGPAADNTNDRFKIEFLLLNGSGGETSIPMKLGMPGTEFHNVYFVELPAGSEGKEYRLSFRNTGISSPGDRLKNMDATKEKNRQFSVAVLVDGVNTIYQETGRKVGGSPEIGPVILHPKNCRKWVLTGPGKKYVVNSAGMTVLVDENDPNKDGAGIKLPGFQTITGLTTGVAEKFTLAKTGESVAYRVGLNNDIGLIALHFYPEDLPGEQTNMTFRTVIDSVPGETRPGTPQKHPTIDVTLGTKGNPSHVARIFYYYAGKPPENDGNVIPITP